MATAEQAYDDTLDDSGLVCPEPLMLVRNRVRELSAGARLRVLATDPTTQRDLTQFCHFMGHTLLTQEQRDGTFTYVIQKKK